MHKLSSLLFILFASGAWASLPLGEGSHCVAYKVVNTMFLVSNDAVVGKNCEISAQILPEVGGKYHIEVNVPVRGFKSGNEERDKDVAKILKGDQRADMTFKSKALSGEEWRALFARGDFPIEGDLFIGSKSYPLTLQSRFEAKSDAPEVDGTARVKFEDFEIAPPKTIGGVIARAKPDFDLYFHLQSQRILGADSIRLGKKQ